MVVTTPFSYSAVSSPRYQTLPSTVLGEEVEGVLGELAGDEGPVPDDDGVDAHDPAGLGEHLDLDALGLAVGGALVDPPGADREREVRVVDGRDRILRPEGWAGSRRRRRDRRPGRRAVVAVASSARRRSGVAAAARSDRDGEEAGNEESGGRLHGATVAVGR